MLNLKSIRPLAISLLSSLIFSSMAYADVNAPDDSVATLTIQDALDDTVADVDSLHLPQPKIYVTGLPPYFFRTPVYTTYHYFDFDPFKPEISGNSAFEWLEREKASQLNQQMAMQRFMIARPDLVPYNIAWLPEAPKQYTAVVNPKNHTIDIKPVVLVAPGKMDAEVKKRHWIRAFAASVQFSQAYISPNWYQGGNNNLNMLVNIAYDVKLNPAYHPNLLFENSFRYKLGMNSAPDDSLRNYSISDDLLQLNSTLGIKAARRWYYSIAMQFKTQLFRSYASNTRQLNSAFLSPGELNVGLGMTYNYVNSKKTFSFDASISPLTYNLKICTESSMDHSAYGIAQDRSTKTNIGSSAELKLHWAIAKNINFNSRVFAFSDYDNLQADWENTLAMDINRFLSTQVYCHLRYDTSTPNSPDHPNWHKLQVKEILSFGFAYKFSSL